MFPIQAEDVVTSESSSALDDELRGRLEAMAETLRSAQFVPGTSAAEDGTEGLRRAVRFLENKLLVELRRAFAPPLVVAVAGGTNVGKSTLFNAILQERVSSIDPRAGHTTSPVAAGGADAGELVKVYFPDYVAVPSSGAAGASSGEGRVYVVEVSTPAGALFVDSPDVDSALGEHHPRARDAVVACDILLFVTSPTKYNDKRCVDVFIDAADMGKCVVVLFNLLPPEGGAPDTASRADILADFRRSVLGRIAGSAGGWTVVEFDADYASDGGAERTREGLAGAAEVPRHIVVDAGEDASALKRRVVLRGADYLSRSLRPIVAKLREQATALESISVRLQASASGAADDYEVFLRGREFLDLEVVLKRLVARFRVPVLDDMLDVVAAVPKWIAGTILRRPSLDDRRRTQRDAVRAKEVELLTRVRVEFARWLEDRSPDEVAERVYRKLVTVDYFSRDLAGAWFVEDAARSEARSAWLRSLEAELAAKIESSPAVRKLLQSLKAVLELGAGIAAAVLTGGLGTGDVLWAPVATKAAQALIGYLGREYFSSKRDEFIVLQKRSFADGLNSAFVDWVRGGLPTSPRPDDVAALEHAVAWLTQSYGRT
jgi:hypothetical protein